LEHDRRPAAWAGDCGPSRLPTYRETLEAVSSIQKQGKTAMRTYTHPIVAFLKSEDGPTAVEYAVMLALIIIVCIVSITALGSNSNKTFTSTSKAVGVSSS
jgi:pilus assembly protein Flp/PilA